MIMAEKLPVKITNSKQFERLVHLMQSNPGIARGTRTFGQNKIQNDEQWDAFATEINSFGPPNRSRKEWQRVWINYKAKTKKKISANNRNIRTTGGGPSEEQTLSALEQVVADILHTDVSVNPPGNVFGIVEMDEDEQNVEPSCSSSPNISITVPKKRQKKNIEEMKVDMLKSKTLNNSAIAQNLKKK
ncbi:PREDICTED: uncharacterized protein LOC108381829 isoform X1 [Rhagoletis zephyria]|uniref:uncharacterized protein LOC108381829 isoform X1 n=1 Tax=Rhagoletis zephyria TaxID=28612 RepID=UPI0008118BF5|nr:PREDICTED: uncharacterized protein LOC108381829 isoform X1 [Rhagoletis zephyria]